jgi:hypothetical protein
VKYEDFEFCPVCSYPIEPDVGCLNCPDEQDDLKVIPEPIYENDCY